MTPRTWGGLLSKAAAQRSVQTLTPIQSSHTLRNRWVRANFVSFKRLTAYSRQTFQTRSLVTWKNTRNTAYLMMKKSWQIQKISRWMRKSRTSSMQHRDIQNLISLQHLTNLRWLVVAEASSNIKTVSLMIADAFLVHQVFLQSHPLLVPTSKLLKILCRKVSNRLS